METMDQTKSRLIAFINETYPDADVTPGSVLNELVIKLAASVQNQLKNDITELGQANSIAAALASEEDTYSKIIDAIASNYSISRNTGRKSSGTIKVTMATTGTYVIPAGFKFIQTSINLNYVTTSTIKTVKANAGDVLNAGEVMLQTDGRIFYFILSVEAENVGSNYQLTNGTKLGLATGSNLTSFVSAAAYGNFSAGVSTETDKELITRLKLGLNSRTLGSQTSIQTKLQETFAGFRTASVVGATDVEMTRAKNNIFGFPTFGMADVYVRTASTIETVKVNLLGTKVDTNTWKIIIPSSVVPGFYQIVGIIPTGAQVSGTLEITSHAYGYEYPTSTKINNLYTIKEARFTKYQTLVIEFNYESALSLNEELFEISFNRQPNIKEIQDMFLSDEERVACADYLVKAVIPCSVSINLRLIKKSALDSIPVESIKKDIFNYINSLDVGAVVSASSIIDICHNYSIKRVDLPVKMDGVILIPNETEDTLYTFTSEDTLEIPYLAEHGISNKNTAFFTSYYSNDGVTENIGITAI